jgi:hypothetical protein
MVVQAKSSDEVLVLLNRLKEENINYNGLDIMKGNLEEVFLTLTGEALSMGDKNK